MDLGEVPLLRGERVVRNEARVAGRTHRQRRSATAASASTRRLTRTQCRERHDRRVRTALLTVPATRRNCVVAAKATPPTENVPSGCTRQRRAGLPVGAGDPLLERDAVDVARRAPVRVTARARRRPRRPGRDEREHADGDPRRAEPERAAERRPPAPSPRRRVRPRRRPSRGPSDRLRLQVDEAGHVRASCPRSAAVNGDRPPACGTASGVVGIRNRDRGTAWAWRSRTRR